MSASVFGSGFGGGGGGGGSITTPVSIANGGTGQTTANAAFNALAALILGQACTFALADNLTNTSAIARVLKHTSSGTTAAGFGVGDAVDLQNDGSAHGGVGQVKRAMTDVTTLSTATDAAEVGLRTISTMVAGTLSPLALIGNNGNFSGANFGGTGSGSASLPQVTVGPSANKAGMYASGAFLCFGIAGTQGMIMGSSSIFAQIPLTMQNRLLQGQGATVASANTLTLGTDGNVFPISGTTTINGITTANWNAGAVVYLRFLASPVTVTNNSGTPGGGAVAIKTSTGANLTAGTNSIMTLMYDGAFWCQTCPIFAGY